MISAVEKEGHWLLALLLLQESASRSLSPGISLEKTPLTPLNLSRVQFLMVVDVVLFFLFVYEKPV